MEYTRLGTTGLQVSRICLGCMSYGDPDAVAPDGARRWPWALREDEARPFFERAIQLLHKRSFREAKEMFEKARNGPNLEIAANAVTHVRMCERRLAAPLPEPKSAEGHYNYAIALINLRTLDQARRHLEIALQMEPRADHAHYAMGVCLALSGDGQGAYDSLKRAIELQPRNRMVARQDSDLEGVSHQPRIVKLLYPEQE